MLWEIDNLAMDLPHLSGATVIRLNIVDDNVIPRSEAVPLISVPSSDQFNWTASDMCFEQNIWFKSASLLYTWKSTDGKTFWSRSKNQICVSYSLVCATYSLDLFDRHFVVHAWRVDNVQLEPAHDNSLVLRLQYFCSSYSLASFPALLNWLHLRPSRIAKT